MMLWSLFLVIASSLGILACYKYPGHRCINHCICLSKMSGKKQISIMSFAQRGKPTKKARLGQEKVVNTLEEEMVEEEETVQVEKEEPVQVEEEETVQVEEEETVEEKVEETVEEMARTKEKSPRSSPTRPLLIVNGPLNGHLLLYEAPAHITGALSAAKRPRVPIHVCGM